MTATAVQAVPTFTATPELPPTPVPEPPTDTPVPPEPEPNTPVPAGAEAIRISVAIESNVRAGPGTSYAIVGTLKAGDQAEAIAITGDGLWLQLAEGRWLFRQLAQGDVAHLPLAQNIPTAPTPRPTPTFTPLPDTPTPTPTSTPTPTPTPRLGDAGKAVLAGTPFTAPDGMRLRIKSVRSHDNPDIAKYIAVPAGGSCRGCLVVEIELRNDDGNQKEYVMLDDFALWTNQPALGGEVAVAPVVCDAAPVRSFNLSPDQDGTVRPKPIARKQEGATRVLCFKGIADSPETLRRYYLLAYSHEYFHISTEPTPTPNDSDIIQSREPAESEQAVRRGWTIFFDLNMAAP